MKKFWLLPIILLGLAVAQNGPRFERLTLEYTGETNVVRAFEVWHDKAGGEEFVCMHGYVGGLNTDQPLTCIPTGRKW